MRVIKHGNTWGVEFTCPQCGCVFKAQDGEYTSKTVVHRDALKEWVDYRFTCKCPECGAECNAKG